MPRPDVSAERKPQILQAAMTIFSRKGYASARMDEIAEEADLSVGILYWYYKGKVDIVLALMKMDVEPDLARLRSLLDSTEACRDRLWRFFDGAGESSAAAVKLWSELYHLAARETRVRKQLFAYNEQYREIAAKIFQQGIEHGEFRADLDAPSAVFALQALFDGFLMNQTLSGKIPNLREMARRSFEFLMEGMGAKL